MVDENRNFPAATVSQRTRSRLHGRMEVSALKYSGGLGLHGRSPLLRLQSDERLVALTRRGNPAAFELLVSRYQTRLLAFCRHMLGSREDAEDVLQDVLTSAYNAMLARRPADQRSPVAVSDRAQPQPEPHAQDAGDRRRHDGHPLLRVRRQHRRQGPRARGVPPAGRRHPRSARDPADRAGPARDGRPVLRADRRGDGDDGTERQIAARPRARRTGRGGGSPGC